LFGGHIRVLRLQLVQQDGIPVYEELPEPPFGACVVLEYLGALRVHRCGPSLLVNGCSTFCFEGPKGRRT
jgi:hypothetical protein